MKIIKFFIVENFDKNINLTFGSHICYQNRDGKINTEVAKAYPRSIILRWPKDDYSKKEAIEELRRDSVTNFIKKMKKGEGVVFFPTTVFIGNDGVIRDKDGINYEG